MKIFFKNFASTFLSKAIIWIVLILGLYFVVLISFGPDMSKVPGDIGDARFNNFILEHFYQWVMGQQKSFWDAPFFYPFPKTIAFSDALLGSAPFYAIFRWVGLSREGAFQGWYVLGFILNYLTAAYVLSQLKLHPVAASAGAFFFAFGLPMLAQNGHPQLIYRIGVPLACYFLWKFSQHPKLATITIIGLWFVWQLYFSIYIGLFLFLLLIALVFLFPLINPDRRISQYLFFWPQKIKEAWSIATGYQKVINIIGIIGLFSSVIILIYPYLWVSSHYGFSRGWRDIATMLPTIKSYFLADRAQLWQSVSHLISDPPMRHEHQLFPGIAVVLLILIGILWRKPDKNKQFAFFNIWAFCFLGAITLKFDDLSLYRLVYILPGFDSMRAITRIILVMMWPIAIFIAIVLDQLIASSTTKFPTKYFAYLFFSLMAIESILFTQITYSKIDGLNRISVLRNQLPQQINNDSILFFASNQKDPWWATEIDAMLLGQELGLNILNGYSGNFPPGYGGGYIVSCKQMRTRISRYLSFTKQISEKNYFMIIKRVIPIGFSDCTTK